MKNEEIFRGDILGIYLDMLVYKGLMFRQDWWRNVQNIWEIAGPNISMVNPKEKVTKNNGRISWGYMGIYI